eukprot:TRINITY_DN7237_c0_g1_i1.p1 TRINITY_DN7237_c0_g1~~TRINITY_DN7237_c0_g1_i1.p1  ORF type:complete len:409 (+),score=89.14 TRINITY_DN7237_c0_g1_i1:344-1570(+)
MKRMSSSKRINIPENSFIELKLNLPRKIPLLTITDNFGHININLKDLVQKFQKEKTDIRIKGESWYFVEGNPKGGNDELSIPQIKISFNYQIKETMNEGEFEWLKLLGRGKFGKVWQVRYKPTGKKYAIKAIRKQNLVNSDKDIKNTFIEKLILSQINHPFIIGLQFAFSSESKLFLGLEYVAGGDLHYHMYTLKKVYKDLDLVHFFGAQLILAIEHLHANQIILRDLKPENILIGLDGYILITDFGLSKISENCQNTFSIVGTLEYIAPEMLKNHKTSGYNFEVDWWSFGILLYELFYNCLPFSSKEQNELFDLILRVDPAFDGTMDSTLRELIWGLLSKNPQTRFTEIEIKSSAFFVKTDWEKFMRKEIEPPYKPKLKMATDLKYFDKEYTNSSLKDSVVLEQISP